MVSEAAGALGLPRKVDVPTAAGETLEIRLPQLSWVGQQKVKELHVAAGDDVAEGRTIATFCSLDELFRVDLPSPAPCRVVSVHLKPGDPVAVDDLVVTVEAPPEAVRAARQKIRRWELLTAQRDRANLRYAAAIETISLGVKIGGAAFVALIAVAVTLIEFMDRDVPTALSRTLSVPMLVGLYLVVKGWTISNEYIDDRQRLIDVALPVHHHTEHGNRVDWMELMMPPSEGRMTELVRDEMARRDWYVREALAKSGMTMADLEEDKWEPLRRW